MAEGRYTKSPVLSLLVRDLNETLEFYSVLGFEPAGFYPTRQNAVWAEVTSGNVVFQFFTEPPRGTPKEPVLSGTVYLFPDDVLHLAEKLTGQLEFVWGPQVMDYGMREFAVRDPNGYLIAFTEPA